MAEAGTVIEGEAKESHSNPEVASQRYEERAKKDGWAPEDQWRGNPEDWVPAKEFLGRQKLYDRIDSLKKTLTSQKSEYEQDMRIISKSVADMSTLAYNKALADLKAERALAIEDRNTEAVEAIDTQIDETKLKLEEAKRTPQKRQVSETADFTEWKGQNSWFNDNQEMRDDAIAIGVGYAAKNPNLPENQVYEYVTGKIKRMYPEAFQKNQSKDSDDDNEGEEPVRSKKVSNVEAGGGNRGLPNKKTKGQLTMDDLNEQERTVAKTLIKRGVFKDLAKKNNRTEQEEYLAQYGENPGKGR